MGYQDSAPTAEQGKDPTGLVGTVYGAGPQEKGKSRLRILLGQGFSWGAIALGRSPRAASPVPLPGWDKGGGSPPKVSRSPQWRLFCQVALGSLWLTLGGCEGSPLGDQVQRSLEPDRQLEEAPPFGQASPSPSPPGDDTSAGEPAPEDPAVDPTLNPVDPEASPEGDSPGHTVTSPGSGPNFIGPPAPSAAERPTPRNAPDLASLPPDLRPYVRDLLRLEPDLFTRPTMADSTTPPPADWLNQPISRRHYARWLFTVNNRLHSTVAAKRLRPGNRNATPAFQDVPPSDPDFGAIQGLAEAGIIPSVLSGNTTAVTFRPDDPLTRETLILWKIPLDTRTALPATTATTVTETWGFQDVNAIDPLALRAIAADFQLGDFANIRRAFGFTTLLQPRKAVTYAEAAAALWRFGSATEGITAADSLNLGRSPQSGQSPSSRDMPQ